MEPSVNGSRKQSLADKYGISLEKLDPKYIDTCSDVKELEKILRILRSGEEGIYEHMETTCESKLQRLAPKSRILRKESPLITTQELQGTDGIADELESWTTEMKCKDTLFGTAEGMGGDENLPPVRSGSHLVGSAKVANSRSTGKEKTKKAVPRDYKEWDKIISNLDENETEAEQPETSQSDKESQLKKPSRSLSSQISTEGMSDVEKEMVANREKDKGNEAFRCGDFMEAVVYYNRSLSVLPLAATYNNRALAYIRVSKWSDAVADCNKVLAEEEDNIKAKLRRACAYRSLGKFRQAKDDLDMVLQVEPQNKRAQDILKAVTKEVAKLEERKATGKGNRMVIEETDGESEDEEDEIIINSQVESKMSSVPSANTADASSPAVTTDADAGRTAGRTDGNSATKSHRITIEEDSGDSSSEDGKDVSAVAVEEDCVNPAEDDSLSNTSSKDDDTKSKKSISRNNSLLSIIQQEIAAKGSIGHSEAHQGGADTACSDNGIDKSHTNGHSSTTPSGSHHPSVTKQTGEEGVTSTDGSHLLSVTKQTGEEGVTSTDGSHLPSVTKQTGEEGVTSTDVTSANNSANSDQVETTDPENKVVDTAPTEPTEPQVIKVPALPSRIESMKKKGNGLFKSGQYGEATGHYTQAIQSLGRDGNAYNLATLYSNRSACYIKTGDCRQAIQDCTTALQLNPHNAKALLRRAAASEALERYVDAYVDYRHVINVDAGASTAYMGANRCERILSDERGRKWRADVPKVPSCTNLPKYELEGVESAASHASSVTPQATGAPQSAVVPQAPVTPQPTIVPQATQSPSTSKMNESRSSTTSTSYQAKAEPPVESNEEKFDRLKDLGNKMVAKQDYELACSYYTKAIDVYPDRVAPYSNRALCYLKTNNPGLAIKDCDTVLAIESTHIKAMFRRAQANKLLHKYKESLSDLLNLLKMDPNNKPAQKECDLIKQAYKKQLQTMKKTEPDSTNSNSNIGTKSSKQSNGEQPTEAPKKAATRVLIEEGSDSDTEHTSTSTPTPTTTATPAQPSQSKSSKARQKKKKQAKKLAASSAKSNESQSSSSVPTLSASPTPYEFTQAWTAMRHITDTEPYAKLLRQISPDRLAVVLSNKLEAEMLEKLIFCLDNHFTSDELNTVESYLKSISTVPRFSMIIMFMSANCKSALESLFEKLSPISSQVDKIRIAYGV